MNPNRSYDDPNRQKHTPGGRPQRPHHNNSDRFIDSPDEIIRTLKREKMELVDENKELRDLNLKHQREIASLQKLLQNLPAAKTERSGPRQNDPIRHDVYPQANTDKAARKGARSNARPLVPTIPSPMTLAPNRHHDAQPQTNTDRPYRKGARSDAIGMAIPVSSTIAPAPKPTIRKSFSGPAPVLNTDTAIRRSPASAVPAKSPDDRYRTDAEIDALVASALGYHI